MRLIVDDEHSLNAISSTTLATYLSQTGWARVGEIPRRSLVYKASAHGRDWGIHVPAKDTFPDHAETIAHSIGMLADFESRDELDVFKDLSSAGADTVTFNALRATGGISLSVHDAGHLLSDTHSLLAWTARATIESRPAFRGPTPNNVVDFLRRLIPLPMAFDEFKVVLFSPIPPVVGQPRLGEVPEEEEFGGLEAPFSRQVVQKLATGLQAAEQGIAEAKQADDISPLAAKYLQGVSANFCGTLADIIERGSNFGSGIHVNVGWASVWPQTRFEKSVSDFSQHDLELLRVARNELLSKAPYMDEHLVAEVVRLEREPDEFDGRALVIAEIDDQDHRVQVEFEEGDFDTVIAAFRERVALELIGDIYPSGRSYLLRNPRNVGKAERL